MSSRSARPSRAIAHGASTTAALALCLSVGTVLAQVNKCTVDGKTIYQQEPCGKAGSVGGAVKMVVPRMSESGEFSGRLEDLREQNERLVKMRQDYEDILDKRCAGKKFSGPVVGMTEADMQCMPSFRFPEKVNVTKTVEGSSKQYIFRTSYSATYIYVRDGVITTIQETE